MIPLFKDKLLTKDESCDLIWKELSINCRGCGDSKIFTNVEGGESTIHTQRTSQVHPKNFEEDLVSEDKLFNYVWKLQSWSEKYRQ